MQLITALRRRHGSTDGRLVAAPLPPRGKKLCAWLTAMKQRRGNRDAAPCGSPLPRSCRVPQVPRARIAWQVISLKAAPIQQRRALPSFQACNGLASK